jgi:hypothetical protein
MLLHLARSFPTARLERLGNTSSSGALGTGSRCASGGNVGTGCGWGHSRVVDSIVALLCPPGLLDPLRVLPWASVAQRTATRAVTGTTEFLRQVLGGNLCEQLCLVSRAQDVNLGAGDRVEELLDHAEDTRETPRRVDDVHLTETLGVVVLRDGRNSLQVAVDRCRLGNTDALQIEDGARGLEEVASLARASGQTRIGHLLVLADEVLNHALLAGDLANGGKVDVAKLLNVQRATVLEDYLSKLHIT